MTVYLAAYGEARGTIESYLSAACDLAAHTPGSAYTSVRYLSSDAAEATRRTDELIQNSIVAEQNQFRDLDALTEAIQRRSGRHCVGQQTDAPSGRKVLVQLLDAGEQDGKRSILIMGHMMQLGTTVVATRDATLTFPENVEGRAFAARTIARDYMGYQVLAEKAVGISIEVPRDADCAGATPCAHLGRPVFLKASFDAPPASAMIRPEDLDLAVTASCTPSNPILDQSKNPIVPAFSVERVGSDGRARPYTGEPFQLASLGPKDAPSATIRMRVPFEARCTVSVRQWTEGGSDALLTREFTTIAPPLLVAIVHAPEDSPSMLLSAMLVGGDDLYARPGTRPYAIAPGARPLRLVEVNSIPFLSEDTNAKRLLPFLPRWLTVPGLTVVATGRTLRDEILAIEFPRGVASRNALKRAVQDVLDEQRDRLSYDNLASLAHSEDRVKDLWDAEPCRTIHKRFERALAKRSGELQTLDSWQTSCFKAVARSWAALASHATPVTTLALRYDPEAPHRAVTTELEPGLVTASAAEPFSLRLPSRVPGTPEVYRVQGLPVDGNLAEQSTRSERIVVVPVNKTPDLVAFALGDSRREQEQPRAVSHAGGALRLNFLDAKLFVQAQFDQAWDFHGRDADNGLQLTANANFFCLYPGSNGPCEWGELSIGPGYDFLRNSFVFDARLWISFALVQDLRLDVGLQAGEVAKAAYIGPRVALEYPLF